VTLKKTSNFNLIAATACLKRCSVAIAYGGELFEVNENVDAPKNLVFLTANLIKSNGVDLCNIDGVLTVSGPGSFTGIRTAQSMVKGIALSLKIPSASVSYFDVIQNIYESRGWSAGKRPHLLLIVFQKDDNYLFYSLRKLYCGHCSESFSESSTAPCFDDENYREIKSEAATVKTVMNLLKSIVDDSEVSTVDVVGDIPSVMVDQIADLPSSYLRLFHLQHSDFRWARHLIPLRQAIITASPMKILYMH
jgi:hypothetical protein